MESRGETVELEGHRFLARRGGGSNSCEAFDLDDLGWAIFRPALGEGCGFEFEAGLELPRNLETPTRSTGSCPSRGSLVVWPNAASHTMLGAK